MSLDPWYALHNNIGSLRMASCGDSLTQGDVPPQNNGGWTEQLRIMATARWGKGGEGLRQTHRGNEWQTSGGAWTQATTSNVWDSGPHQNTMLANGATKVYIWTPLAGMSVSTFSIWIVDGPASGNFSYSLNGGSTWIDTAFTFNQNNQMKEIRINQPVTTTLQVRAATAAGVAVNVYLVGMEPYTNQPGLIFDNTAHNGDLLAFSEQRTTVGQRNSYQLQRQQKLYVMMYWNDTTFDTAANWQAHLEAFDDMVMGWGGCVLHMSYQELDQNSTVEAAFRAATKTVALEKGMPLIDFYDLIGDHAASVAGGYLVEGNSHPTNKMATFMATEAWKVISRSGIGTKLRAA